MHYNSSTRIAFVQQGFGSVWSKRSRACIKRHFPESMIIQFKGVSNRYLRILALILLKGITFMEIVVHNQKFGLFLNKFRYKINYYVRLSFDPLHPIIRGIETSADYIVNIDEDCFLTDRMQLLNIIDKMDKNPEIVLAGPAEGGTPYRENRNPFACNLFFNIIKRKALKELFDAYPEWRTLRVNQLPENIITNIPERGTRFRPAASIKSFNIDDHEPYYPLYWLILSKGYKIQYLPVSFTDDLRAASAIRLPGYESDLCFHMWLIREWIKGIDTYRPYGRSNPDRYEAARKFLAEIGIL